MPGRLWWPDRGVAVDFFAGRCKTPSQTRDPGEPTAAAKPAIRPIRRHPQPDPPQPRQLE